MGTFLLLSKSSATFWLHASEAVLLMFSAVVVVGLIGENKCRWPHPKEDIFLALVIIGVAGELLGDGGMVVFTGQLQTISDAEVRTAISKAGDAQTSAHEAANAAERADSFAAQAQGRAANALTLARGAHQEADSFEKEIAIAKKQATEAESHLGEALQRAREVEQAIAWRHLSPSQVEKIRSATPPSLVGLRLEVHHLVSDAEAQQYASEIADALRPKLSVDGTTGYLSPWGRIPSGVAIFLARPDTPGGADLQRVLQAGGIDAQWGLLSDWQISSATGIVVFVWPKPR
jgi:hypothetical protein